MCSLIIITTNKNTLIVQTFHTHTLLPNIPTMPHIHTHHTYIQTVAHIDHTYTIPHIQHTHMHYAPSSRDKPTWATIMKQHDQWNNHQYTKALIKFKKSLSNCTQQLTKLSCYSSSGSSTEKLDYCWQKWVLKTVHPGLDQLMEMNCFVEVRLGAQCCMEKVSTVPSLRIVINLQMSVGDWISCLIFLLAVVLWFSLSESAVLVLP